MQNKEIKIFKFNEVVPPDIIKPKQVHGVKIVEIIKGNEDLQGVDGIWTKNSKFKIAIGTADCAPVCFLSDNKIGIVHVGWRGLVGGICEKMLEIFQDENVKIFVGPLYPRFEIQKDGCFDEIKNKFGEQFFDFVDEKIYFNFTDAISSVLPNAEFDPRFTFEDTSFSSWRRDMVRKGNNLTVIIYFCWQNSPNKLIYYMP